MTAQEYKQAGFTELSVLIPQSAIDRAEADVKQAYITPIVGEEANDTATRDAVMNLTVLLLMQRTLFATRSGAKEKATPQSYTADRWDILSQASATCAMKIKALADAYNVKGTRRKVNDICGIYFRTNFLGL